MTTQTQTSTALQTAIDRLHARILDDGDYVYRDEATRQYYRVDPIDLESLGERLEAREPARDGARPSRLGRAMARPRERPGRPADNGGPLLYERRTDPFARQQARTRRSGGRWRWLARANANCSRPRLALLA